MIIKECDCMFAHNSMCGDNMHCSWLKGLNQVGRITRRENEFEWNVKRLNSGENCHFREEQLILKEKEIKLYGIAKFLIKIEKEKVK